MKPRPTLPLLALLLMTCACPDGTRPEDRLAPPASSHPAPVTLDLPVTGGNRPVLVELAITGPERNLGLMNRTSLGEDAGMLFLFPDSRTRQFWMKNTLIPLDILFLDDDGTVQNIAAAQPYVEQPGYFSLRSSRIVLELNQGWCKKYGLVPGAKIPIPAQLLAVARE